MALTQRLEFRQSQSLVMTPQLMQAIKLLQLSNLDLSAFVEEELERNPLLERANDGPEPPVAGEPTQERSEFRDADEASAASGEDFTAGHSEMSGADGFEPAQEEWLSRDLGAGQCVFRGAGRGGRSQRPGRGSHHLHRMGR